LKVMHDNGLSGASFGTVHYNFVISSNTAFFSNANGTFSAVSYDVASQQPWWSVNEHYYDNPYRPISITYNFDNATHKLYDYTVGPQGSVLSDIWNFDSQGHRTDVLYSYPDGSLTIYEYDVAGHQSYSSIVTDLNSNGHRADLTYVNRDGTSIVYTYDPENQFDWSQQVAALDSNHHVLWTEIRYDNGLIINV
jgi:hypothetical protein